MIVNLVLSETGHCEVFVGLELKCNNASHLTNLSSRLQFIVNTSWGTAKYRCCAIKMFITNATRYPATVLSEKTYRYHLPWTIGYIWLVENTGIYWLWVVDKRVWIVDTPTCVYRQEKLFLLTCNLISTTFTIIVIPKSHSPIIVLRPIIITSFCISLIWWSRLLSK